MAPSSLMRTSWRSARKATLAGVRQEGGQVAGEEHLLLAIADHDPARVPDARANDDPGLSGGERHDRLRAREAAAGLAHGREQVVTTGQRLFEQMRDGLGVGLAGEGVAAIDEFGAEGGVVLDDAVVDDDDIVPAAHVGMGVRVAGGAVGGPARVADARVRGRQRLRVERVLKLGDLAAALGHGGRVSACWQEGDAGRVVAAVFEGRAGRPAEQARPGASRCRR